MKLGKYQFQHESKVIDGIEIILPKMPKNGKDLEKKKKLASQYRTAILGKLDPKNTSLNDKKKSFASAVEAKFTWIFAIYLGFILLFDSIALIINIHNFNYLFGDAFSSAAIFVFALLFSFSNVVFLFLRDQEVLNHTSIIIPLDMVLAVLIAVVLTGIENIWVTPTLKVLIIFFYAWQMYRIIGSLYKAYNQFIIR